VRVGWLICACLLLSSCGTPGWEQRTQNAAEQATQANWQDQQLVTRDFTLQSWHSPVKPGAELTIYIEGDGLAWISRHRPSGNPTPKRPLALELALSHPRGNVVYLGRPCQYVHLENQSNCNRGTWTNARFSESVVRSTNQAVDKIKHAYNSERITLVGYSGGAAVAVLVAARRNDVEKIITVAGNLDHRAWTTHHRLQPLKGSLNPPDVALHVAGIPQLHYVGSADEVIPPEIARSYQSRFSQADDIKIEVIDGFDHHCCWQQQWHRLSRAWLP
jgi:pimeloyl-ACP methyl ester carboxylesterase